MKQIKQYTSRSDYWNTPKNLYKNIIKLGFTDYNPENSNIEPFNIESYKYHYQKVFINPPFSLLNKPEFLKLIKELENNKCEIMILIPSRTDTKYFHEILKYGPTIYFIKGRLSFNEKGTAPFPSLIIRINDSGRWQDVHNIYMKVDKTLSGVTD